MRSLRKSSSTADWPTAEASRSAGPASPTAVPGFAKPMYCTAPLAASAGSPAVSRRTVTPSGGSGVRQRPSPSTISGTCWTFSRAARATSSSSGRISWIHSSASGTPRSRWRVRTAAISSAVGTPAPGIGRA